jgi:polyketide biosynthesis enoyl-CoA hydratase PksI
MVNKNAFSSDLVDGLIEAFDFIRKQSDCRVVILTGYDNYFASGGTQAELLLLHEGKVTFTDLKFFKLPLECEVPVIAAMQGHGIGGGFVFGLFSDTVVLSRESIYAANFMKYGFTPGMGATFIMPRKLGISLATEMFFTANGFRGAELEKRGVPFAVLPRCDVLAHSLDLARRIAEKPRNSLVMLKNHLVADFRQGLPMAIEMELAMHKLTIHQPEVKSRIMSLFGK